MNAEPTGLLIDSAMNLILSCIPEVSVDERREALLRASNLALMRGVTTVVDFGRYFPGSPAEASWEDFAGADFKFARYLFLIAFKIIFFIVLLLSQLY